MDNDGPSSVKGRNGLVYTDSGTTYPCATAIGCTWNVDLAYEMGKGAGKEAADMGTDTWYRPVQISTVIPVAAETLNTSPKTR